MISDFFKKQDGQSAAVTNAVLGKHAQRKVVQKRSRDDHHWLRWSPEAKRQCAELYLKATFNTLKLRYGDSTPPESTVRGWSQKVMCKFVLLMLIAF